MMTENKIENLPKDFQVEYVDNYMHIFSTEKNIHIKAKKVAWGINVILEKNITIQNNSGGPIDYLEFGDNVWMDHGSKILVPEFVVLDYTKINNTFFAYGTEKLTIGYNCWIGGGVILDTLGGLTISNNVCIASRSQIYTHAKFGDTAYGCRFHKYKAVLIGEDAWIAPGSIIIMSSMAEKSMLLAGSILTKDTEFNLVYAGSPATNISDKTGRQFEEKFDYDKILLLLKKHLNDFYSQNPEHSEVGNIKIILDKSEIKSDSSTYFVIKDRKYTKKYNKSEIAFMKYLLPEKAKFIPYKNP